MQVCGELVMGTHRWPRVLTAVNTFPGPTACHLQTTKQLSTWLCSSPSPDRSVSVMSDAALGGCQLLPEKTLGFQRVSACAVKIDGLGYTTESKSTKAQPGVRWQHGMYPDSRGHQGPLLLTVMGSWNPVLSFMVEI